MPFSRVLYIEQRRLPRGSAEEVLPARAGPRSAAALRLLRHVHGRREGSGDGRDRRAATARTIRRRAAATRPTAARSRPRCTGSRPRTRWTPRSACTTGCSTWKNPARHGDYRRTSESRLAPGRGGCQASSRQRRRRRAGHPLPVRAARLLLRRSRSAPGAPGVQPHRDAEGRLGEDRAAGIAIAPRVNFEWRMPNAECRQCRMAEIGRRRRASTLAVCRPKAFDIRH